MSIVCVLCPKSFSSISTLWHHVNTVHICRGIFPPLSFFTLHKRMLCSLPSCRWATHSRFKRSGCTRPTGHSQHCHAPLVDPSQLSLVPSCCSSATTSEAAISSDVASNHNSVFSSGVIGFLTLGIQAVNTCSFGDSPSDELSVLNTLLHQAMISYVPTVQHIPHSVRPLLAQVLISELLAACSSTWGLVRLLLFAKAVLRLPSSGR